MSTSQILFFGKSLNKCILVVQGGMADLCQS